MPAEEQEPGKAPGKKGRLIRSILALPLLASSCLVPQSRYFQTAFASGHVLMPSTDAYQQLLEHINTSALDEEQCCICSLSSHPPQDHLACGLSDCLSSVGRQFNSRFFGTWYMS